MHFSFFLTYIKTYRKNGGAFMLASLSFAGFLSFLSSAVFGVGYISGSSLFPEPLSSEEEKQCLERLKNGDD